jgi:hypothetical protein
VVAVGRRGDRLTAVEIALATLTSAGRAAVTLARSGAHGPSRAGTPVARVRRLPSLVSRIGNAAARGLLGTFAPEEDLFELAHERSDQSVRPPFASAT